MKVLVVVLFATVLAACSARFLSRPEERIIGGSDAKRRQFPHMVSVQLNGGLWCGGTIVAETWVVSAAHCYETPEQQTNLTAVAGLLHFGESHPDVQTIPVDQVINHPEYIYIVDELIDNDISLLKLASPLTFTAAVQPATLPPVEAIPSGRAWLSGWGVYLLPSIEPGTLQCLEMPIITKTECEELFTKVPQTYKVLDNMVCVAPPTLNETGCYGDSGGPLAQDGTLLGITSFGSVACALDNAPTVFTSVSYFIDFINEHIKDN